MPKNMCICICITLVALSLMFGNGNYNTEVWRMREGVPRTHVQLQRAAIHRASPTGLFPVEGQPWSYPEWFNIVWGDGPEGATQTIYTLTDDSGQITPLLLDETRPGQWRVLWFDRKKVMWRCLGNVSLRQGAATGLLNVTSIPLLHPGDRSLSGMFTGGNRIPAMGHHYVQV